MLAQEVFEIRLREVRDLVYDTLCDYDRLLPGVFPMTEKVLFRGDAPCGVHFCLHGPRNVKYTSIWETDKNSVLYYNSIGERFRRTELMEDLTVAPSQCDAQLV